MYRTLPGTARVWREVIRAWLAWRLKAYREAHPDRPEPVEVILKHRFIPTPKPTDPRGWVVPIVERPFARWKPATDTFEVYNAVNKQFVAGVKP